MAKFVVDQILESGLVMKLGAKHFSCPVPTLTNRCGFCVFGGISRRLEVSIVCYVERKRMVTVPQTGKKEVRYNNVNTGQKDQKWYKLWRSIILTERCVTTRFCAGKNNLCKSVFIEFSYNNKKATISAYGCQTHPNIIIMGVTI